MINNSYFKEFTSFANILANESEKMIMQYFRKSFTTEIKDDRTPVTIADKNTEQKIRDLIKKKISKSWYSW